MKFDVVLGNPPYQGKAALHQQFFNKGVDLLNDNGHIVFVQPATPYFNKKDKKKGAEQSMIDNIKKYSTSVKIYDSKVFEEARIQSDVAVTVLNKRESGETVTTLTYKNGMSYNNIDIQDINMMQINPYIYQSIKEKYVALCVLNGRLDDVAIKDDSVAKISLPEIRGTFVSDDDYFTFLPKVESKLNEYRNNPYKKFGLKLDTSLMDNVYDYLKSYVARFGMTFIKYNQHLDSNEMLFVPLVDFSRTYTDQELFDMLGLTTDEIFVIKSVISNYYDR